MITVITGFDLPDMEDLETTIGEFYEISPDFIEYGVESTVGNYFSNMKNKAVVAYPEYKLHPSKQSELISCFIKWSRENEIDLIVLTQSDHIVNGLLTSVYENFKDPSKGVGSEYVKITFYGENEVVDVPVSDTGRIQNPPKGFFDQINIDLKKLLR